jgi:hypothetical protein
MTNSTHSTSSQAPAAVSSLTSCSDIDRLQPLKSNHIVNASSAPDSVTARCPGFRSTAIFANSPDDHIEASWIASLAASRARTSRALATERASTAQGPVSGTTWHAWSAKFDRDSYSWRTRQISLFAGLPESSRIFSRCGTAAYGMYWELATWAPRIDETGSGYLPTPTTADNMHSPSMTKWAAHRRMYSTPTASDGPRGGSTKPRSGRTPRLNDQVGGPTNPRWIEWLMGWPAGWVKLKPLETDKFHEWLRLHGGHCIDG